MQGVETDTDNAESRVTIDADGPAARHRGVQRAAEAASAVSRALSAAGYEPHHLSVTLSERGELVLVARIGDQVRVAHGHTPSGRSAILARLAIGLILGVLLGFLGLPRLELPATTAPAAAPTLAPATIISVGEPTRSIPTVQTPNPPQSEPTAAPTAGGTLFERPLTGGISGWTNDPAGTAWFAPDGYHLLARDAGRFVATSVPLPRPVQDITMTATFHKVGGPPGGGYGLIVRDQSAASERDGRNQAGRYLVAEVGDRGDVGVWQRDDTHWIDILPWTHSEDVHPDRAPNTLAVTTHGSSLLFKVNGATVATVNYDKLPNSGNLGVFVGGDLNEVTLDRLQIANSD
jgi:hypothetical protein